jgi:single-stranded DNA-binding protein
MTLNRDHNHVTLSGRVYGEPRFETIAPRDGRPPFSEVRFQVFILKEAALREVEKRLKAKAERDNGDLFRVVMQGAGAELAYFYLRHAARITVIGKLRKRFYTKDGRKYHEVEVVAESVTPGYGADFERGERQREQKFETARDQGLNLAELGLQPVTILLDEGELDQLAEAASRSSHRPLAQRSD